MREMCPKLIPNPELTDLNIYNQFRIEYKCQAQLAKTFLTRTKMFREHFIEIEDLYRILAVEEGTHFKLTESFKKHFS